MKLLLGLLTFLLALGQLQRIAFPWGAQYAHELILIFLLFNKRQIYIRTLLKTWKKTTLYTKLLIALVIGGVLLNWIASGESRALLLSFRAFLYASTAWAIYLSLTNRQKQQLRLFLLASGIAMAATGILQYIFLPDVRFLQVLGWDDHYYRAIGSMLDPNYLGILLLLTLANLWTWTKKVPAKLVFVLTAMLSATIAATLSRATYLATAVFFATQFLTYKKLVVLATISLALTLVLLPKPTGEGVNLMRTSSITSRIANDQAILQSEQANPMRILFGNGLFTTTRLISTADKSRDHGLQANNIFVFLYQSLGVVGSILLLPLLVRGIKIIYQKEPAIAFALVGIFVHAQFNNSFFEPIVFSYWVFTVATLKKPRAETK